MPSNRVTMLAARMLVAPVCALMCIIAKPSLAAEARRPVVLPAQEVKVQLQQAMARIRAWSLEYEVLREDGENRNGVYIRKAVAAKDPDCFFLWAAKGSRDYDWRDDPFQQRLTVRGARAVTEWPFNREFNEFAYPVGAQLPGTAVNDIVLVSLGWWSLSKRPSPATSDGVETVLSAVARSPKYSVLPDMADVEGRWCYVLEYPGRDRIWVDPERGYAMAKRERYNAQNGTLIQRFISSGHSEVERGIWAPARIRRVWFDPRGADSAGATQPAAREGMTVLKNVLVNDRVPDTLFVFEALLGSLRFSPPGQPADQAVPGGSEHLDRLAAWIHEQVELPQRTAGEVPTVEAVIEYVVINVCVLGGIVAYLRRRGWYAMLRDSVRSGV
jgi:hypothetical protein